MINLSLEYIDKEHITCKYIVSTNTRIEETISHKKCCLQHLSFPPGIPWVLIDEIIIEVMNHAASISYMTMQKKNNN